MAIAQRRVLRLLLAEKRFIRAEEEHRSPAAQDILPLFAHQPHIRRFNRQRVDAIARIGGIRIGDILLQVLHRHVRQRHLRNVHHNARAAALRIPQHLAETLHCRIIGIGVNRHDTQDVRHIFRLKHLHQRQQPLRVGKRINAVKHEILPVRSRGILVGPQPRLQQR